MKFYIVFALTLMALGSLAEKGKGRKSFILPSNSKLRRIDMKQLLLQNQNEYEHDDDLSLAGNIESEPRDDVPSAVALKPDSSSGRLFFKKFFLSGKQTPPPQFIIITQPAPAYPPTSTSDPTLTLDISGNFTTSPAARTGDISEDYITGEDDEYEDEIAYEKPKAIKEQHTTYKLIKGKGNQQGISFVVPSKYMRNLKNKRNSIVVNPSAAYNTGAVKTKKLLLNNNGNSNIKKKRSRSPVRRFIVSQN